MMNCIIHGQLIERNIKCKVIFMREILRVKLKCSEDEAGELAKDLESVEPQFKDILDCWCNDRAYTDIEVGGYTLKSLMDDYDFGFVGALLTLDWIYKEPETEVKALGFGIR